MASCPLNEQAKQLIFGALPRTTLWKILPYNIIHQNLGVKCRVILPLNTEQLLVLYDEVSISEKFSKIKIWDMQSQDWVGERHLPKV